MLALAVSRTKTTALELPRFARRVRNHIRTAGHHYPQHLLVNINRCYSVRHVILPARKWQNARQLKLRTVTCYRPSSSDGQRTLIGPKTRVPDQTPSRPRLLQSGNDLSPSSQAK